jgi:hypothetical protein
LKAAGIKLSREEKTLFGEINVIKFFASAVRMTGFPSVTSFWPKKENPVTPVDAEGQPIYFTALHASSGIANVWSWDKLGATYSELKAKTLLIETLSKFNKNPRDAQQLSLPVTQKDVLAWSGWVDYFPHLNTASLANNWYAKFNANQGNKGTYFASGVNGFETVEFAIRAGQTVVKSYF